MKSFPNFLLSKNNALIELKPKKYVNKAVDDFLPALKFVPEWLASSKLMKKLRFALFTDNCANFV